MKALYAILCFPLLLAVLTGSGQQNVNWYFGRKAGLSFSASGSQSIPVSLTNSAMLSDEGCASVSDDNGNLLFYTNGIMVYNRQHQQMLNGDGLDGNISSAQIVVVQMPGHDSLYYIFTSDAIEHLFQNGYKYSIVNIKGDGGKGEVITKNVSLWPNCTERITAARHANGTDIWLITNDFNSNTFRSWLINCSGLQPVPVVSVAGITLNLYPEMNAGIMKVSPDGRMLCQTHFPLLESVNIIPNYLQAFDFDNLAGVISNPRSIGFPGTRYTHCEFSSDSRLLYLSRPYERKIDQLKITLPTIAAIQASRTEITTNDSYYDMQMAPDEKVYLSQPGSFLACINNPATAGAGCNLVLDAVNLAPNASHIGLPFHMNDFVLDDDPNNGFSYSILDSCSGTVQFYAHTILTGSVSWQWDFGDGGTSTQQNPIHVFTPSGSIYTVKLKIGSSAGCGQIFRSARVKPSGTVTTKPDFDFVIRCDSGYVRFINKTPGIQNISATLTWDFGDGNTSTVTDPIHTYSTPGTYRVKLKLSTGLPCLDDETELPVRVKDFTVVAPPDQTIVVGQSVWLSTESPATSYQWSPATWLSNTGIRSPVASPLEDITYTINAANGDGCKGKDSITIHVLQYNDIYVPTAFTPNGDGKNDEIKPFFPGTYVLKEFSIFNRWGQKVFTTSQRGVGWNGKVNGVLQNTGVYAWTVTAIDIHSGEKHVRKGTLAIIK